ncbi:hypothetical protein B0H13DRAFT_2318904 [Mycena leptocephala]|nr:hypothetical protein B0H13DRAFT_2318904 [Mycena leptocephala]
MDAALKKRKNADAQAAFCKRCDTYIQLLEGAVTNLEPMVQNLQEVLHESRIGIQALQVENTQLRSQLVEQEKLWRAAWQSNAAYPVIPDPPELESHWTSQMSTFIDDNMVAVPHDASEQMEVECCLPQEKCLLWDRVRASSPTPKPVTKRCKRTSDKEDDSLMLEKPPPAYNTGAP